MTFRHTTVTQIFSLFTIIIIILIIIIIIISTHWLVVAVSVFIFFTRLLQGYFYGLIFVLPCFETLTPLLLNILTHSFTYFSCVKFTNSRYRSEQKRLVTISVKIRTTNGRCERLTRERSKNLLELTRDKTISEQRLRPVSNVVLPPCRTQFINYKYIRIHFKVC